MERKMKEQEWVDKGVKEVEEEEERANRKKVFRDDRSREIKGEHKFHAKLTEPSTPQAKARLSLDHYDVYIHSAISINTAESPELAQILSIVADSHNWKPVIPQKIGYVEFHAEWKMPLKESFMGCSDYYQCMIKEHHTTVMNLDASVKSTYKFELGSRHGLPFYFMQAWLDILLYEKLWQLPSKINRVHCCVYLIEYIVDMFCGKAAVGSVMEKFINIVWGFLQEWCRNPSEPLEFTNLKGGYFKGPDEFELVYKAAKHTNIRFFAIDTIFAQLQSLEYAEWISDYLETSKSAIANDVKEDLKFFKEFDVVKTTRSCAVVSLREPKFYKANFGEVTESDAELRASVRRPVSSVDNDTADPMDGRMGSIPSVKEVEKQIRAQLGGRTNEVDQAGT